MDLGVLAGDALEAKTKEESLFGSGSGACVG